MTREDVKLRDNKCRHNWYTRVWERKEMTDTMKERGGKQMTSKEEQNMLEEIEILWTEAVRIFEYWEKKEE